MTVLLQHCPKTIIYFEGVENYTRIHFKSGEKLLASHTLLRFEEKVEGFIRVNRKYLVNKDSIAAIKTRVGKPHIVLADGRQVFIPRRKVKEFE